MLMSMWKSYLSDKIKRSSFKLLTCQYGLDSNEMLKNIFQNTTYTLIFIFLLSKEY